MATATTSAPTIESLRAAHIAATEKKEAAWREADSAMEHAQRLRRIVDPGVTNAPSVDVAERLAAHDELPIAEKKATRARLAAMVAEREEQDARDRLRAAERQDLREQKRAVIKDLSPRRSPRTRS